MNSMVDLLIKHEGFKRHVYKCTAGKNTIGVGRNLDDVGLSDEEIMCLLSNDIRRCKNDLNRNFEWFPELNEVRQMALIDMCFNLGISRLKRFKNMIAALSMGDYGKAADEAKDSAWYDQVGSRAVEVCAMIRHGR